MTVRREPTWDVLDLGEVPEDAPRILYACQNCEREALLPVVGMVLAQVGSALVFDSSVNAMPKKIRCRLCRKVLERVDAAEKPAKERA